MALTKAQKDKLAEQFRALGADEQEAIREAAGNPPDLMATIETMQKELKELREGKSKKDEDPSFFDILLGRKSR